MKILSKETELKTGNATVYYLYTDVYEKYGYYCIDVTLRLSDDRLTDETLLLDTLSEALNIKIGYKFKIEKDMMVSKENVEVLAAEQVAKPVVEIEHKEAVNHPSHYNSHPSGIECIEIACHHDFCIGSAIKYLWRAGLKTEEGKDLKEKTIEDLKKAVWFIEREIKDLSNENNRTSVR